MKKMFDLLIMSVFLFYSSLGSAQVQKNSGARDPSSIVKISYITRLSKEQFEKKIIPFFKEESQCSHCQLDYIFVPTVLDGASIKQLKLDIGQDHRIVYFDFNLKMMDSLQELKTYLDELTLKEALLVTSAGEPLPGEPSLPLRKTLWGQLERSLIIGEVSERDRLLPMSYFGPEIFTALRSPSEFSGQRVAPVYFLAKLASQVEKRTTDSWWIFFKEKKAKNKRLWLELGDLFY